MNKKYALITALVLTLILGGLFIKNNDNLTFDSFSKEYASALATGNLSDINNKYQGKTVRWEGLVLEVEYNDLGTTVTLIKSNRLLLVFYDGKRTDIKIGQRIKISGRIGFITKHIGVLITNG